jgi:hypothetical protein
MTAGNRDDPVVNAGARVPSLHLAPRLLSYASRMTAVAG